MLIACLCLGKEISNLDLGGKVVEGDSLVMNKTPSEMGIYTNMLARISCNLKSPSVVTVKGEWERRWSHPDSAGANGAR